MHPLAVFAFLVALVLVIGALAIAGVRKARSMSRKHMQHLNESGQMGRTAQPRTTRDRFLRPMSFKDTVLLLVGAAFLVVGVRAIRSWLGW